MESFTAYKRFIDGHYFWSLYDAALTIGTYKIYVPDQWEVYETYNGKLMILSPQNRCYDIEKILHGGEPYFKYLDGKKVEHTLKLRFKKLD